MRSPLLEAARFALLLGAVGCALLLQSPARADDLLIGSVFGTHFSGNTEGYGDALAWQHTHGAAGFVLGASDSNYPVGTLSELDVDAYRYVFGRLVASLGGSFGALSTQAGSNPLYKARVSVDAQINSTWSLHGAYQYLDVDPIHVQLLSSQVQCRPFAHWSLSVGGTESIDGTTGSHEASFADRYADAELDWYGRGTERYYGGVLIGRLGYDPVTLGTVAVEQRLFQLYLGAAVPIPAGSLTLGIDTMTLGGSSRQTLRVGIVHTL